MDHYASFSADRYRAEYYAHLDSENRFLLYNLHEIYNNIDRPGCTLIDVGSGPTVYQLISASRIANKIIPTEYLARNRLLVDYWAQWPKWDQYFSFVAAQEGNSRSCMHCLRDRLQKRLAAALPVDLSCADLGGHIPTSADIISSAFCFEGISNDYAETEVFFKRLTSLVKPGGLLVLCVVIECNNYKIAETSIPATYLTNSDLEHLCSKYDLSIEYNATTRAAIDRGYGGITMLCAKKNA